MFLKIIEVDPFLSGNATLEALLSGIATSRVYGVNLGYYYHFMWCAHDHAFRGL